jgi:integrase
MAAKQRLTDAVIKRIAVPNKGYTVSHDSEARGFAVRVTAKGVRSFILNYYTRGGRDRSYTIGQFPDWVTTAARARARELRVEIDAGGDPLEEIEAERSAPTVADLCDRFEAEHLPRKRPSTAKDYRQMLASHIRPHFGAHAKVADVSFADVDALHRKITRSGATYAANRCVAILSKMFSLAVRWGMRETNPAKGVERNTEHHRRRYLSGDELGRLVAALTEHPDRQVADAIRMLLLTGARRSEVLGMRWPAVDLGKGVWSKPPSSTKQKQHHEVPLSAPARALLSRIQDEQAAQHPRRPLGEFVFPCATGHLVEIKRNWAALCKAAGISDLRLHDLRHSYASALVSSGASLPLIGAMLGHASPTTTARYAHMFADPMAAAAEKIGALIENATAPGAPDKVVPLAKSGGRP